ncbi:MAG: apolipoprotein N-acyltransferase [Planctomycetes bacterium]|nr:apolipoprotein N-acyltransferase [Planctomycetota bacterium]
MHRNLTTRADKRRAAVRGIDPTASTNRVRPGLAASLRNWSQSTLGQAGIGAALFWAALPPLELWPLAWIAPIFWMRLVGRKELPGRRPYRAVWLAGFVFWLAALHWLRFPHWGTAMLGVLLALYLGSYLPLFIGLSRVAVHRWRVPVILATPAIWGGLELARAHVLTGFSMGSLAHTQYRWLHVIQIADLGGEIAVGAVIIFAAACLGRMWPCDGQPRALWPAVPLVLVLAGVLGYGHMRLSTGNSRAGPTIALIQGSIDTQVKADSEQHHRVYEQYFGLSREAVERHPDVDLLVWPETMYRDPWLVMREDLRPPPDTNYTPDEMRSAADRSRWKLAHAIDMLPRRVPMLLGVDVIEYGPGTVDHYNSAVLISRDAEVLGRYDKMHPVMFGEYVPLGRTFPWIYDFVPGLAAGLTPGARTDAIFLGDLRMSINICYESVLSHLIRRQVSEMQSRGEEPNLLVNLTNDGWFYGSSELDMHLVCGVFRAVECRKPLVIAANTGFSASIDANGAIHARGPRRDTGVVIADVLLDGRDSLYLRIGDWPWAVCLIGCILLMVHGLRQRFPARRVHRAGH